MKTDIVALLLTLVNNVIIITIADIFLMGALHFQDRKSVV